MARTATPHQSHINHKASFATTFVNDNNAHKGFHMPYNPPCTLNLCGQVCAQHHAVLPNIKLAFLNARTTTARGLSAIDNVYRRTVSMQVTRWLRSPLGRDARMPVYDVRNAMEQYWVTPDPGDKFDEEAQQLLAKFRAVIETNHPIARELHAACALAALPGMEQHDVCLQFARGDAGPQVSAVFHTRDPDRLPPEMQPAVWPRNTAAPTAQPVDALTGCALACPALLPGGLGNVHPDLSVADFVRYLAMQAPGLPQFQLCPRVFQELLLTAWNATDCKRLGFFYNRHTARAYGIGADDDGADADFAADAAADDDCNDSYAGADANSVPAAARRRHQGTHNRSSRETPFYKESYIPAGYTCGASNMQCITAHTMPT